MEKLIVSLLNESYPVYISKSFEHFIECLGEQEKNRTLVILTDNNVEKYHLQEFYTMLRDEFEKVYVYVIKAEEEAKNLLTIEEIYAFLQGHEINRKDVIIAFGGGVVGDITGFVASTYMRGISFVQVPTTLLAQVDSSIGGKTGVNFNHVKNAIGSFYQPRFVYANIMTLKTLPRREFSCGLSEIIIHSIIGNRDLFDFIRNHVVEIMSKDEDILRFLIKENCKIKIKIVEKDVRDTGERKILNFGHTFGHGIEGVYLDNLYHGECVAIGSVCAFLMAEELNLIKQDDRIELIELLKKVDLPYRLKAGANIELIYNYMLHDKKNTDGNFTFILPRKIGEVFEYKTNNSELIKTVLNKIVSE